MVTRYNRLPLRNRYADRALPRTVSGGGPERGWSVPAVTQGPTRVSPVTASYRDAPGGAVHRLPEVTARVSTWVSWIRLRSLEQVAGEIDGLSSRDVATVDAELSSQLRAMARAQVSWRKVAAVGAVGVGLGAATMGVAAPAIGAMIGGAAGLSGAAATSAGLAMLGGGSLAAGGLGVSGGTAVLVGAGTLLGAGVGAGGARIAQVASGGLVREVVRTEVHTRVVVIKEKADDEAARRVVVAMEGRLDEVTGKLGELAGRLRALSQEKKALQAELGAKKDTVTSLLAEKEDLRLALEAEQQQTALAQVALSTSIKRLGDTGSDVGGER